jgi:hypothetical protein
MESQQTTPPKEIPQPTNPNLPHNSPRNSPIKSPIKSPNRLNHPFLGLNYII